MQVRFFCFCCISQCEHRLSSHLAPVPLTRGAGRSHLCLLLALLEFLSSQHNLTGIITATWAIPITA